MVKSLVAHCGLDCAWSGKGSLITGRGSSTAQIQGMLGVSEATLNRWQSTYGEMSWILQSSILLAKFGS